MASDSVEINNGWLSRRILPDSDSDIFVALRYPGLVPSLLFEVDAISVKVVAQYPSARGFELYPEIATPGPRGRTRLCLVLSDIHYREVFGVLVNDVSERVAQTSGERECVMTLLSRLRTWQNFMKKHGPEGLTKEARTGLYGELSFLVDHLMLRLGSHDSVNAWEGPVEGNQDFKIGRRCLEVKSTTVIPPTSVRISSITQLDETLVELLLLCHMSLILDEEKGESLPELVDRLRAAIRSQDVSALDEFNTKLIEAGYLDQHRKLYVNTRYKHWSAKFYKVNNSFPRITIEDIRSGISECNYTIFLAACAPYEISVTDAISTLLNEEKEN